MPMLELILATTIAAGGAGAVGATAGDSVAADEVLLELV